MPYVPSTAIFLVLTISVLTAATVTSLNAPGDLDPTFSGDGKLTDWSGEATGVAIQSDGKIVVVGTGPNPLFDYRVARYNPDGSPDTTFGNGTGRVTTDFGQWDPALGVVIQPDGKIVVAGSTLTGYDGAFALVRYTSDGSLDTEFGGGTGKVLTPTPGGCAAYSYGVNGDVELQPDGKILGVVGYADIDENCETDGLIFRYHSDGSTDTSFGDNGALLSTSDLHSLSLQPADGKIVAQGSSRITRFNTNGALDTDFGLNGVVTIPSLSFTFSLGTQSDGKILSAGTRYNGQASDFAIFRFNPNGSPDTSFDADGVVTTTIGPGQDWARSVVVQSDGKILAAGITFIGSSGDFAIARYHPDGSLDSAFGGGDGITTVDFSYNDGAREVVLDRQGRAVVVGGTGFGTPTTSAFAIVRLILGPRRAVADFDGDGRSDISVFRPSDRTWYLNQSTAGFSAAQFGISNDDITPADFDGDGKTDIAIFRDGVWWRMNSSDHVVSAILFGLPGDLPVPADYTGDGRNELAVYRNGQWWIYDLSNGQVSVINFGLATDRPVPSDFDGDGRVDQAVYRNGEWHVNRSTLGYAVGQFGLSTDTPVVGDYDGDFKADLAVYRDGTWYLQRSTQGFAAFQWGLATDIPTPADYDGDGKTDAAVYRDGTWYVLKSTGGVSIHHFGLPDDTPVPSAFIPSL